MVGRNAWEFTREGSEEYVAIIAIGKHGIPACLHACKAKEKPSQKIAEAGEECRRNGSQLWCYGLLVSEMDGGLAVTCCQLIAFGPITKDSLERSADAAAMAIISVQELLQRAIDRKSRGVDSPTILPFGEGCR